MTFLDKVKDSIVEFLRPGVSGELKALQHLYDNSNAGNLRPNTWNRIVQASTGRLCGFSFVCKCAREFQLVHPNEWMRDYECPQCQAKFNLYKQAGIIDAEGNFKVAAPDIERILSELPVRPRMDGARTPNFIDVWDNGDDGGTGWSGGAPQGANGSWV